MRRSMVASSVLVFALAAVSAREARADDAAETEEVEAVDEEAPSTTKAGKKKVRVIVIDDDEEDVGPRRKRRKPRRLTPIDGEDPPEGYRSETTNIKGLWVAGVSLFGASYFLSIVSGGIADAVEGYENGKHTYFGLIPVVGPFITAGHPEIEAPGKIPFILFGAMQAAGVGMFIGGLAAKKEVWVASDFSFAPELVIGPGGIGMRQQF